MFWDFGSAGSAAAAASIGKLLEMSKRLFLYIASDCDTLLKSLSESADRENTYPGVLKFLFLKIGHFEEKLCVLACIPLDRIRPHADSQEQHSSIQATHAARINPESRTIFV